MLLLRKFGGLLPLQFFPAPVELSLAFCHVADVLNCSHFLSLRFAVCGRRRVLQEWTFGGAAESWTV